MRTKEDFRLMANEELRIEIKECDEAIAADSENDDPYDDYADCLCTEIGFILSVMDERGMNSYAEFMDAVGA